MTIACRRCLAPSLCVIPMPPRITRKSTRPRASDRSMVDTVQPHGLFSFETDWRRRYSQKMQPLRWHNPGHHTHERLPWSEGLDVAIKTRASGGGRKMFLTSPYIDQAITLRTIVDVLAIYHQRRAPRCQQGAGNVDQAH